MDRIGILLFSSISTLANALVVEKNGFFQYHVVFITVDDFGEKYPAEITNSTLWITWDMNQRTGMTENPTIYERSGGSKLISPLAAKQIAK